MRHLPSCFAAVMLIALAGCGEIAIKRGSGADALAADRASCRAQNTEPAAARACLVARGWHVTDLALAPAALPAYRPAVSAGDASPRAAKPDLPPSPVQPVDGSDLINVGNWWHFGGGPADLHASVDACVAKLGAGDRPDAGYHRVTRALYACLSAEGWRSLGSRPE